MNFIAYGELRILGYDPETAVEMSKTYTPVGMYEQKPAQDWPNSGPHPVHCIGLKDEWKRLLRERVNA